MKGGAVELERPPKALIAEGDKLFINGKLEQALQLYNEVLERDPTDHAGLVARSRCYTQLGELELAVADADKVLAKDKLSQEAMYRKAEALFQLGRYEHALVFYHRGHMLRPEVDHFRIGIQKAQEAVLGHLGMNNLKIVSKTGFETDRKFLKQILKTEPKNAVGSVSAEVRRIAQLGLDYLDKTTEACMEVQMKSRKNEKKKYSL
ncbi:Oidioi.mRNA.OKI2018_I69.chr1.g3611.t1.cds [Oikopleura dioica]|uniref:Outer dynein arm-docking complex subunit 4 n=1 Tax=Oikopleura dioica TaxID=34765 RepID=A0ABN7T3U3_OIKDI|nr:Oidioi.mRNA.OKI2018_I69.chr1.g3611.t1.cds [Oikopleura dioica]